MKTSKIKFIQIIVFITIMISLFSVQTFASETTNQNLNYNEFFSQEHYFEDLSAYVDSGYLFGIDGNGKLYRISEEKSDSSSKEILYSKAIVSDYAIVKDKLVFIANEREIYSSSLDGSSLELIFEIPAIINNPINLFADESLIWFRSGADVYRLHRQSGTLDKFYSNDKIIFFSPVSNFSIKYTVFTQEWLDYVNFGGDLEDGVNFSETATYVYDSVSDNITLYQNEEKLGYSFLNSIDENAVSPWTIFSYNSYSIRVYGKPIPYSSYPLGSYIGEYSTAPCTHHTTTNVDNCDKYGNCGCQVLGNLSSLGTGIQCNGFARQIYGYLFGKSTGNYANGIDASTTAKVKTLLSETLHPGALIRANGHSLVLVKATSTYADFYHANYDAPCMVSITRFDYSDFKNEYSYITYYYDGLHYYVTSGGQQVCSHCRQIKSDTVNSLENNIYK